MRTLSRYCFTCMALLADVMVIHFAWFNRRENGKQCEHVCFHEMHSGYYCRSENKVVHKPSLGQVMYAPRVAQKVVFQRRVEEPVLAHC